MKPKNYKKKRLTNLFYLKHYSIKAGNNNPKLLEDKNKLIKELEELALGGSRVLRHSKLAI